MNVQIPTLTDVLADKVPSPPLPERVLQFGEGNFLRGFVDWMLDRLNEETDFDGGVHITQPIGSVPQFVVKALQAQDHAYTVLLRGLVDGRPSVSTRVVRCVQSSSCCQSEWPLLLQKARNPELRFVVSNTTEAGIAHLAEPWEAGKCPTSFPGKVTALLYERYRHFEGAADKGLLFLPCELIEANGDKLRELVLRIAEEWHLGLDFIHWVERSCHFANTLVDRIVPGYPADEAEALAAEWGYRDDLVVCGEPYHLWAIQGDEVFRKELPFDRTDLHVVFTDNLPQYRSRKVKVLNGIHTMSVLLAHLAGVTTVREMLEHPQLKAFIAMGALREIAPTIDLPLEEKEAYIHGVMERFANPFIRHACLTISLNSVSKFRVRVLPTLLERLAQTGSAPRALSLAFAALLRFYRVERIEDGRGQGSVEGALYPICDDPAVLERMRTAWQELGTDPRALTARVLGMADFWGEDLSSSGVLVDAVSCSLSDLLSGGASLALARVLEVPCVL